MKETNAPGATSDGMLLKRKKTYIAVTWTVRRDLMSNIPVVTNILQKMELSTDSVNTIINDQLSITWQSNFLCFFISIQRFRDMCNTKSHGRTKEWQCFVFFCYFAQLWFVYVFLSVFLHTCKYHCSDLWSLKDFLPELKAVVVSAELLFALRGPLTHVGKRPDTYILPVGKVRSLFNMKLHGLHWCLGCICYPSRSFLFLNHCRCLKENLHLFRC